MPSPSTSTVSRKRTRSNNISESTDETTETSSTSNITPSHAAPPKRQRNNTNYSLRNRSTTPDTSQTSTQMSSIPSQRYNLRPRTAHIQPSISSQSATSTTRARRQIASSMSQSVQSEQPLSTVSQPRQYRFVYISDDDDPPITTQSSSSSSVMNTTLNLITDDEDEEPRRAPPPPTSSRRTARSTANTRARTHTDPTSASSAVNENSDHSTNGTGHIRLNRAIEIVIDSIQSLEGAVNNFDQLFFSLIYGRLSTRNEFESFEGMIRLSRILNLNFPSRLTQDEIDALPKIQFSTKSNSSTSLLLVEKCPICLTEFSDEEIINKLHCSHLFHLSCISTWLSENDSCPTCRRKVNGD